jgi:formylglycine-generating enzyme required for sulfatase activity/TolB-like protein
MKNTVVMCVALCAFAHLAVFSQNAQDDQKAPARPKLAVFGFNNLTGDSQFDIAAETSSDNLAFAMRMLGKYDVSSSMLTLRNVNDARLGEYCADTSTDFVLIGSIGRGKGGGQAYTLSVYDRGKGKTSISKTASGSGVLDVFGITDDLTLSVLSAVTGRHVGFGSISFANSGENADYEVEVDGASLGKNPSTVDHIVDGVHVVKVFRGTGKARSEILSNSVTVTEGAVTEVPFKLEKGAAPKAEVIVKTVYADRTADKPVLIPIPTDETASKKKKQLRPFQISVTEVTQTQYKNVMDKNPSAFNGVELPVENVSWYDAIDFCNALSASEGLSPAYSVKDGDVTWNVEANGYRLPTEEEWIFAAAAGGKKTAYPGSDSVDEVAWTAGNSSSKTHSVALKKPNGFGIYDMAGNVSEWCWTGLKIKKDGSYPAQARGKTHDVKVNDGGGNIWVIVTNDSCGVIGGSWKNDNASYFTCGKGIISYDAKASDGIGFRVCRNTDGSAFE